jgi:hypothetical protein
MNGSLVSRLPPPASRKAIEATNAGNTWHKLQFLP